MPLIHHTFARDQAENETFTRWGFSEFPTCPCKTKPIKTTTTTTTTTNKGRFSSSKHCILCCFFFLLFLSVQTAQIYFAQIFTNIIVGEMIPIVTFVRLHFSNCPERPNPFPEKHKLCVLDIFALFGRRQALGYLNILQVLYVTFLCIGQNVNHEKGLHLFLTCYGYMIQSGSYSTAFALRQYSKLLYMLRTWIK